MMDRGRVGRTCTLVDACTLVDVALNGDTWVLLMMMKDLVDGILLRPVVPPRSYIRPMYIAGCGGRTRHHGVRLA